MAGESEYQKLPGRHYRLGTSTKLWLGGDHILLVKSTGYTEDYKRFYFRDIQAILISQSPTDKIYSVIWTCICVICALLAATSGPEWAIFWGTIFVIFGVLLGINLWRGPSAKCKIRTAVQTEELPSLNRVRLAEEVVARVKPLIEQAQGRLDAQQMPQMVDQLSQVVAPKAALSRSEENLTHYNGRAHEMLFYFLVLCALFNAIDLAIEAEPLVVFDMIFSIGVLLSGFLAAIKQHRASMPAGLKRLTWISFVGMALLIYAVFMGANVAFSMGHPGVMGGPSLADYGKFMGHWVMDLIVIAFCAPLGAMGIYLLSEYRSNRNVELRAQAAAKAQADAQARAVEQTRMSAQINAAMPLPVAAAPLPPVAPIPEELTSHSAAPVSFDAPAVPPPAPAGSEENAAR